ncbi:MAG: integral rane protein, partial [Actinomycetia bacterium]|nr:integral rane protein [Actinomycetes bacterium]
TDIRRYGYIGGQRFLRTGSVFLDPTPCGFFLVLPFAAAVERRLRAGLRNGGGALLLLIGVALLLTQTRAALVAGLVVAFLAVRPAAGRTQNRRLQFALLCAAGVVVLLPTATASGLSQRVTTTASSQDQSSSDHVRSFWNGVHAVGAEPIGHGLGTSAGVGQRFAEGSATVPENSYLQVGIETGVLGMAVFIALTVVVLRRLTHAAGTVTDVGISVARTAGVGLAIGACLLPAWNEFAVAWPFWGLAGAAIGLAERRAGIRAHSAPSTARETSASS